MALVVRREPEIASLGRRLASGIVDGALMLAVIGAGAAAVFALLSRLGRRPAWFESTGTEPSRLQRWGVPLAGASMALVVCGRNWRTPGMRMLGLRRVDVRTGGPVRLHSAVVETAAHAMLVRAEQAVRRPSREAYEARRVAANEAIERMRDADPNADPRELLDRSRRIQREARVGWWRLAARVLVGPVVAELISLRSARRQTPVARLAGTAVIHER